MYYSWQEISFENLDTINGKKTSYSKRITAIKSIGENIKDKINVNFTYFIKDKAKDGGAYITISGNIKKIDKYKNIIVILVATVQKSDADDGLQLFCNSRFD